jgi:hypothetical protein
VEISPAPDVSRPADKWAVEKQRLSEHPEWSNGARTTADLVTQAQVIAARLHEALANMGSEDVEEAFGAQVDMWLNLSGDKLERIYYAAKAIDMQASALRDEEERLAARRKSLETQRDRVKALGVELMLAHEGLTGENRRKCGSVSASLQRRKSLQGELEPEVADALLLPSEYEIAVKLNRAIIKKRLEASEVAAMVAAQRGLTLVESTFVAFR